MNAQDTEREREKVNSIPSVLIDLCSLLHDVSQVKKWNPLRDGREIKDKKV